MQKKKGFLIVTLSLSLLLTSCVPLSIPTNANTAFENFTLQLFKEEVVSSTLGLHYTLENPKDYGIEDVPVTLGTFEIDPTSSMVSIENCQAILEKFPYHRLTPENQATYDVLSSYLISSKKMIPYSLYEEPLSPITGIHTQLPILLAEYKLSSEDDIALYLELLKTIPDYFSSLISFEQQKADAGLFMSCEITEEVLAQCNSFLSMGDDNYLLSTFEERLATIPTLSSSQKETFINQNKQILQSYVLPAYEKLNEALCELQDRGHNSQGLCYFPKGKEYYTLLVARETGSSQTIDHMLSAIQTQIADDLLSMRKTLDENPSITETVFSEISSTPESILNKLEKGILHAFPAAGSVTTEIKYVPSALEEYLSPAFYLIPAIDNISQNTIYINRAHNIDGIHLFTTLAHEGYPGHLYQTTYYSSKNPDPLRTIFNYKGYVEGWATYAEMCSYYLSPLKKEYASFLQKNSSLILGLYAHADIGIHYGGWNLERTQEFFQTYGITDPDVVEEIYRYILGDPANYLSYYIGYLEILDLKRKAMEQEGEDFSQKEFHQKVLDIGPAPFDVVNKYVFQN